MEMLSSSEIEQLLQHTMYNHHYDDDSDADQEVEGTLPICLPTPLILVGDDDSNPRSANTKPLPLSSAAQSSSPLPQQQQHQQSHHPCRFSPAQCILSVNENDGDLLSQSENNISNSSVTMQLRSPPRPPPYTPADSARVAAEVDCCSAIEKTKVKTVMCLNYMHGRRCRFGAHCAFAHGVEELRQPPPEMMAKKKAIVASSKPPLTETPPPSYRDALAAPPAESQGLGATPAYEDAVREQQELLPPPLLTDVLHLALADAPTGAELVYGSSKHRTPLPARQRVQTSGGSNRLMKLQPHRVKLSPV